MVAQTTPQLEVDPQACINIFWYAVIASFLSSALELELPIRAAKDVFVLRDSR